jgi:hypothetical protein
VGTLRIVLMKTGFVSRQKQSLKEQPVRRVSQKIFIHCGLVIMLMAVNISTTDASSPCDPGVICVTGSNPPPLGNPLESLQDEYLMSGDEYADMDVGLDPGTGEDLAANRFTPGREREANFMNATKSSAQEGNPMNVTKPGSLPQALQNDS